jgi:hypothetical protein
MLRSPQIAKHGQVYVTYSNQIAQGKGAINGFIGGGYFLLDHDQRNTLHFGGNVKHLRFNGYLLRIRVYEWKFRTVRTRSFAGVTPLLT